MDLLKRALLLIIVIGIISGCKVDLFNDSIIEDQPTVNADYQKIMNDMWRWYKPIMDGYTDEWALPDEFVAAGGGDCEDWVLFFLYVVYERYGIKGRFYHVEAYKNMWIQDHAIAWVDGIFYDVGFNTTRSRNQLMIYGWYSYDTAMWLAEYIF